MKFSRSFALIATASLLLAACGKDSEETKVTIRENTNPLLVHVPADTAYVIANLELVPKEITDAYIARFQPVIDVMSRRIDEFQADQAAGKFEDDAIAMFATAVLDELGGELSVESLEKFGISPQSFHAIYAMGVFPVIRMELTDATELRNAIGRIEAKMGVSLPVSEFNGVNYWRLVDDDSPVGVYISILDQQLAISAFPVGAEGDLLGAFLGEALPANSMASSNALAILNNQKGYSGYGSGIIDFQKLSDELFKTESATHSYLGPEMSSHLDSLDAVCLAEVNAMIAKAPRMTAGTMSLTANEMAVRYELEIENTLATSIAALVSDTPPAVEGDFLVSASLAIQVGKLRNFILEKANSVIATPYQCEKLENLNAEAQQLAQQLNIPMPPMVNNLEGLRVRMDEFDPTADMNQASGVIALHVDKPEMFVGMASMLVPGFDTLDLANQKEPVKIPSDMIPVSVGDVFAMMNEDAIGVATGEQQSGQLKEFMTVNSANEGTVFSVSYDLAKQMEIQQALSKNMNIASYDNSSAVHELSVAMQESYEKMLGRSRFDIRLTPDGMVTDIKITYK